VSDFASEFATPEWVYYVLPGGLLLLGCLLWLGIVLRAKALAAWAPAGAGRITLGHVPAARYGKLALAVAGWALVCVALARPQGSAETAKIPRGGTDLMVLVDVSNSMLVGDMGGGTTRLDWARRKLMDLLDEIAHDPIHRVGLMPFAGEPFALVPPTPDHEAVRFFIEDLNTSSVALGGSDLARAIDQAADDLDRLPGEQKAILVISDGDAIAPEASGAVRPAREKARLDARKAVEDAHRKGVLVFALGVGDVKAREVMVPDDEGGASYVRYEDEAGADRIATSALDESTLAVVGADGFVRTTFNESDILNLLGYGMLTGGATGEEEIERSIPVERFRWPLLAAFALLLAEMFVPAGAGPGPGRYRDDAQQGEVLA
jgi:Ca-activated chloride channel family protein